MSMRAQLVERGAEGIILGCTEIRPLVGRGASRMPLFDKTAIHAEATVESALELDKEAGTQREGSETTRELE